MNIILPQLRWLKLVPNFGIQIMVVPCVFHVIERLKHLVVIVKKLMKTKIKRGYESRWYRRLKSEIENISPHIRFKDIRYGFARIFWIGDGESAYIGEAHKNMSEVGYDIEEKNFQLESKKYFEEFEDNFNLINQIKNFREGFWDSLDRLRTNIYLLKNNSEHRKEAQAAFKQMIVK